MSTEPPSKVLKMTDMADIVQQAMNNAGPQKPIVKPINYEFNDISDDNTELRFKKLSANAITPVRGSRNAAGFDLFSAEEKIIPARSHGLVMTDISVALPKGSYGRVAPRSGLAVKKFIDVGAGVVDVDYRGNVGVVIFNHFSEVFEVKQGDRIAQFVVEKIFMPKLIEVVEELDETERGSGGFGSTGR